MTKNKDPIIEVKNLSKQYRIGVDTTYKILSESVTNTLRHPLVMESSYIRHGFTQI